MSTSIRVTLSGEDQTWTKQVKEALLKEFDDMYKLKEEKILEIDALKQEIERLLKEARDKETITKDSNLTATGQSRKRYSGTKKENFERWFEVVNSGLIASGIPEDMQLHVISNYLKGSALATWLKFKRETGGKGKVEELFKLFRNSENKVARYDYIYNQLLALKQENSFDEYLEKFKELAIEASMTERDLIIIFRNGLSNKTKYELITKAPVKLEDAYCLAAAFEECVRPQASSGAKSNVATSNQSNSSNKKYDKKMECSKCHKKGHHASKCKANVTCHQCVKKGHYKRDCRSKPKEASKSNNVEANESSANMSQSEEANAKNERLMVVSGLIDNRKVKRMALDIGADVSIMSTRLAKRLGIKLKESDMRIKVADDRHCNIFVSLDWARLGELLRRYVELSIYALFTTLT